MFSSFQPFVLAAALVVGCDDGTVLAWEPTPDAGVSACEGVSCASPPPSYCADSKTLVRYSPGPGTCVGDGSCKYASTQLVCDSACVEGVCHLAGESCGPDSCHGRGLCDDATGGVVCSCAPGWGGARCEEDVDECVEGTADCSVHASCVNAAGGYACVCGVGYDGDGVTCSDVDGCAGAPCFPGVTCTDVAAPGAGFTCGPCPAHYEGDGETCTPTHDCDPATCDDGVFCNGTETCQTDVCVPGVPPDCSDGIACTTDSCSDSSNQCEHVPLDAACDDGVFCNGIEVCESDGCVPGVVPNCSDGIPCTMDHCSESSNQCEHVPDDSACDDGMYCSGIEVCTEMGCQAGVPVQCPDDGAACTAEACSEEVGTCVFNPDDSQCPTPGDICVGGLGCVNGDALRDCMGKYYECGDSLDNDGDGLVDSEDPHCLGVCDNTEAGFHHGIPAYCDPPCNADCYFDGDLGSGNDECYWSYECDPLGVAPDYPPWGSSCEYNPTTWIPGLGGGCADAYGSQSPICMDTCLPLTPNGCDCFGCCEIPGAPTTVWLGSRGGSSGSCHLGVVGEPDKCRPCTVVPSCWNSCEDCELCVGKPDLPPTCEGDQSCAPGQQACGLPGQNACPAATYCITGCCQPLLN